MKRIVDAMEQVHWQFSFCFWGEKRFDAKTDCFGGDKAKEEIIWKVRRIED